MALNLVPQPGQSLDPTQAPILSNFTNIDANFAVDHQPFATTNAGYHNQVTIPVQAAPGPAGVNGTIRLFSENVTTSGGTFPNLFYTYGLGTTPINMTGTDGTSYTTLPSGIQIKWGSDTTGAPGVIKTITFAAPFTTALNAQVSILNLGVGNQHLYIRALTNATLQVFADVVNVQFYWSVMGK